MFWNEPFHSIGITGRYTNGPYPHGAQVRAVKTPILSSIRPGAK